MDIPLSISQPLLRPSRALRASQRASTILLGLAVVLCNVQHWTCILDCGLLQWCPAYWSGEWFFLSIPAGIASGDSENGDIPNSYLLFMCETTCNWFSLISNYFSCSDYSHNSVAIVQFETVLLHFNHCINITCLNWIFCSYRMGWNPPLSHMIFF